jgi:hypothetical protein
MVLMRKQLTVLILASLAFVGCTDEADELSSGTHGVITTNKITSNRIAGNRIAGNRIAGNRIAGNRIAGNRFEANVESMGDLLATPEGQELLAFLIGCALPEGVTLTATDPAGGPDIEFFGEIGVAPDWATEPLDRSGRRWVTACILSRVNDNDVTVEISIRGPNPALDSTAAERLSHSVEEGAFYGDIFGPLNHPLQWYACRGADQAAGETGGLVDRDCAEPDPTNKGHTLCGFIYAGDCADFAAPRNKYACQSFSDYYEDCETKPRHKFRHHQHVKNHKQYDEVITTFLAP